MRAEHLLDAMEYIDRELILEAEEAPVRRRLPVWQLASAAVAAVVLCAGLYLLPAMQPAGMAAPEDEAQNSSLILGDTADGTNGDYEYRTEGVKEAPSASQKQESAAGETHGGVVEPQFFTERGVYLFAEFGLKQKLPENVRYLGELSDVTSETQGYPAVRAKELVGQPVWESEDGEYLYVQMPEGGWWTARLCK